MGGKAKGPGRPRKPQNALGRWLDKAGVKREDFARRLGVTRTHLDRLCRSDSRSRRRPGLDLALQIEALTSGSVPASPWASVPPHSAD
jgi:hypothetical protein